MKAIKKIKEVVTKAKKHIEPEPKAPAKKEASVLCECGHFSNLHYGSELNWCNQGGCNCQEYKVKESA